MSVVRDQPVRDDAAVVSIPAEGRPIAAPADERSPLGHQIPNPDAVPTAATLESSCEGDEAAVGRERGVAHAGGRLVSASEAHEHRSASHPIADEGVLTAVDVSHPTHA